MWELVERKDAFMTTHNVKDVKGTQEAGWDKLAQPGSHEVMHRVDVDYTTMSDEM